MTKLSHSHSAIKLYEQCPRKYWHLRVVKDTLASTGTDADYGNWVHKAFEDHVGKGEPLPATLEQWEPVLSRFLRLEHSCELPLVLDENLKLIEGEDAWNSPAAWFRCKIDLYAELSPLAALIVDYKTGKRKPDFDQLELNALCIFQAKPEIEVVVGAFLWTKFPEAGLQDQMTYARKDMNALWAKHMGRIRNIYTSLENDNWPAKPSGLCKWRSKDGRSGQCEAYDRCPYGGGA